MPALPTPASTAEGPRAPLLARPLFWVGVALVVRIAYLVEQGLTSPLFTSSLLDEKELADTARALLDGQGFGAEPFFKAPAYSVFLAATMAVAGEGWFWLARALQHVAGAALVAMAFDTARRLVGPSGRPAWLAGGITAALLTFYGPLVRLEDRLILDFATVFLQSAMLWALVRMRSAEGNARAATRWAAAAGAMATLAWLTRPTLTPILPFLALWIVARKPRVWSLPRLRTHGRWRIDARRAALFLGLPVAAMALVALRNRAVGGEGLVLPWQGGYSFYEANRRGVSGRYLVQTTFVVDAGDGSANPARTIALAGYVNARRTAGASREEVERGGPPAGGPPRGAVNTFWFDRAKAEIRADPAAWLGLMLRKAVYLTSEREIFNIEDYRVQRGLSLVLPWLPIGFGVVWPFALASLALWGVWPRGRRSMLAVVWLYAVLLAGAIALYYTSGRMRMPLVFPAAVLGGAGLALALTWDDKSVPPRRAIAIRGGRLALFALGLALSWGDWWGVRTEATAPYDYARMSNGAWSAGHYEDAYAFAVLLREGAPDYPQAPQLLGQALDALGRYDEAAAQYEESMKRLTGDPKAPYNLGLIHYYREQQMNPQAALADFAEALRRMPRHHQSAWMAALAAHRTGDTAAAARYLGPYLGRLDAGAPRDLLVAATALALAQNDPDTARQLAARLADIPSGADKLRLDLGLLGYSDADIDGLLGRR